MWNAFKHKFGFVFWEPIISTFDRTWNRLVTHTNFSCDFFISWENDIDTTNCRWFWLKNVEFDARYLESQPETHLQVWFRTLHQPLSLMRTENELLRIESEWHSFKHCAIYVYTFRLMWRHINMFVPFVEGIYIEYQFICINFDICESWEAKWVNDCKEKI